MAIKLSVQPTERILFCGSKWWGDPDMLNLLQLTAAENFPIEFEGELNLLMKPADLGYGNWKKTVAHL